MRLKLMAMGTVLLTGVVGAAFGQPGPGRDNNNREHQTQAPARQEAPRPSAPVRQERPPVQTQPVQRTSVVQRVNTDYRVNNARTTNNRSVLDIIENRPANTTRVATQPVQRTSVAQRVNTDYRINNAPTTNNRSVLDIIENRPENTASRVARQPVQVQPEPRPVYSGPSNAGHHTGNPPSRPVHVGGTIKYQNPNHGGGWRNDDHNNFGGHFSFGLYLSNPSEQACYVSPWYYYGGLPAYVPATSVTVDSGITCQWNQGSNYTYGDLALDQSVTEIQNMFLNRDGNAPDALVPSGGQVGIFTDGRYDYSLNAGDFQEMLSDNTQNVDTIGFRVTQIRRDGNQATVKALHTAADPNGGEDVVYQVYRLQNEDGRYVITDFMTSHNPL